MIDELIREEIRTFFKSLIFRFGKMTAMRVIFEVLAEMYDTRRRQ
jgi:hypothetical protein